MNKLARFQRLTRHGGAFLALALFLALAQGLLLWSPSFAAQNTITVFTDDDTANGNCTLREAIRTFSNNVAIDACLNDAEDDTITLLAGTYNLTLGTLFIERAGNLTIQGAGANQTIINVSNPSRAFEISTGANVTIRGVTIRNANAIVEVSEIDNGSGGAIYVNGSVNGLGATLTLENSVLENNTAVFGGGVLVFEGTLNIIGSTIANNTATTRGGGVFINASTATIVNSTISGNSVLGTAEPTDGPFDGGGIRSFTGTGGALVIRNSTISGNTAPGNGGGIANSGMNVTLSNTILAGNTSATAPDCVGAIGSAGYNLIGNNTGCTFTSATGDQVGTGATPIDPQLGALQNNGGTTPTRALAATSPALDLGNPAAPGAAPACAPTDQRGIARPQGTRCDIGAFELTAAETNPLPTLSSINPTSALVGAGNTTLTVNGSNFVNGAVVRWDGVALTTQFVSPTQLTATIPAANLTTAGTRPITVFNPGPGGGVSAASQTFTINNPAPTITSITPTSATVGSGNTQLTVNGTGFVNNVSVVRWNGTALTTQFVSATQLTATIPAANLTATGTANITVFNPTPGGGESAPRTFAINNPVPTVTSVSPNSADAGAGETVITVTGTNFVDGAIVRWNGTALTTQFVSATQLTAAIPAANLDRGDTFDITVFNPAPGGGTSNTATFTVNNPAPTLTSISPQRVARGSAAFTLTVNGTGFVPTSQVQLSGANRAMTFVSSTQLTAAIPASDLVNAGTFNITVVNPGPGGGISAPQTLTVFGPPTITTQPEDTTIDPGNQALLSVAATGEQPITYQWYVGASPNTSTPVANGDQALLTVSPTTTTNYWVRVTNAAGSVDSESALVTVTASPNPVPTLTAISPTTVQAGSNGFTLVVTGNNFVPGAVVRWNNQDRQTTRVSSSRLEIAVSASDIANAGTVSITVFNPGPGGGSSAPQTLTITAPANPAPTLTAISPATVQAGSNGFTLVVTGSNFVPGAVVRWNNQNRQTTRVSSSRLEIAVSASDIANAGTVSITVFNPGPGGGSSAPQTLTITAAPTEFRLFLPLLRR